MGAHPIHRLLHLAHSTVAAFHSVGGRRQQLLVEECQRLLQDWRAQFVQALSQAAEPPHPLSQSGQFCQRGVRPAAPVKQPIDFVHDGAHRPQLRLAPTQLLESRPLTGAEVMADEQMTVFKQFRHPSLNPLGTEGFALRLPIFARTPAWQFGGLLRQTLAKPGDDAQHHLGQLLENVELAHLMRHAREDLGQRVRIQSRSVRGDPAHRAVAGDEGVPQATEETADILVRGVALKDFIQQAALVGAIHGRQHTEGTIVHLIENQVAGEAGQSPIQVVGLGSRVGIFSPPPRPSFGSWGRGRKPGGPARGARTQPGRADRPPPPRARPPL